MLSLGREKEGREWMEKACTERDESLLYFSGTSSYEKLRSFPGWDDIERRMGIKYQKIEH